LRVQFLPRHYSPILVGSRERNERAMRYLVHRGTGTILGVNDDLVIVDLDDSIEQEEEDILELADNVPAWNKAIVLRSDECPVRLSDEIIFSELNDYVYNWNDVEGSDDDYLYCLGNPDTWALIRSAIMNDDPLWNEYSDTWSHAISSVAEAHRERNGVAE
jgi:hypothetical protein